MGFLNLFRSKENAQRKYIELIRDAAAKWPNWDPPNKILPGDFGTVDKKSGRLNVEGNIYNHPDIEQIASNFYPIPEAVVNHYHIESFEVDVLNVNAAAGAGISKDQSAVFNFQWQFNNKRGAVLLMHRPQMIRVPDQFFPASLHLSILKGKHVVSEIWKCPGYYMYLSTRASEQVTVGLRVTAALPVAPGVGVNAGVTFSWSSEGGTGVRQDSYDPESESVYTPLFCLKSIRRPLLMRAEEGPVKETWYESDAPWDDLNEEGESEKEEDYDNNADDD